MSGSHIVVAGDTLSGIAKQYGLSLEDLVNWNDIKDPALIKVGQKIELSGHGNGQPEDGIAYQVASGDTFSEIAEKFGVNYKKIMEFNGYEDPTKLLAGSTITIPYRTHTVESGDTFFAIGKKYGVGADDIMKLNGYEDPTKLPVGVTLTIPFAR